MDMPKSFAAKILVVGFGAGVLVGYLSPAVGLVIALSFALAGLIMSFLPVNEIVSVITRYAARRLTIYFAIYVSTNFILAFSPRWIADPLDHIFVIVYSISIWTVWTKVLSSDNEVRDCAAPPVSTPITQSPQRAQLAP